MVVAEQLCLRLFRNIGDFFNVKTSQSRHQHKLSSPSVTNMDSTNLIIQFLLLNHKAIQILRNWKILVFLDIEFARTAHKMSVRNFLTNPKHHQVT